MIVVNILSEDAQKYNLKNYKLQQCLSSTQVADTIDIYVVYNQSSSTSVLHDLRYCKEMSVLDLWLKTCEAGNNCK